MKKIFSFLILNLYLCLVGIACDFIFIPFCESSSSNFSTENIVSGIITQHLDNGIQLEVIEVLRGTESRTILTVWNGTDIDCNGNHPMDALAYGMVGDTVIAIIEDVIVQQNDWDIIGDYRRPSSLSDQTYLPITNDSLDIFGDNFHERVAYNDFIENTTCFRPNHTYPISNKATPLIYPNPVDDFLYLNHLNWVDFSIFIHNAQGNLVKKVQQQQVINIQNLEHGIYFLVIKYHFDNQLFTTKFIKK